MRDWLLSLDSGYRQLQIEGMVRPGNQGINFRVLFYKHFLDNLPGHTCKSGEEFVLLYLIRDNKEIICFRLWKVDKKSQSKFLRETFSVENFEFQSGGSQFWLYTIDVKA